MDEEEKRTLGIEGAFKIPKKEGSPLIKLGNFKAFTRN
jgi:hypothetical protein|tara:strand:+ start:46 stop:159 length:114 start_codon:yes stop_codon:yes gene_type:complete